MGMVAGAVGVILVLTWWIRTHMQRVTPEEAMQDLMEAKLEEDKPDE